MSDLKNTLTEQEKKELIESLKIEEIEQPTELSKTREQVKERLEVFLKKDKENNQQ